jgi:hypothetical protein
MEWLPLLSYFWTVALGTSPDPVTPRELAGHPSEGYQDAGLTSLDLELVAIMYGAMLTEVHCANCGEPLDPEVRVEVGRRSADGTVVVVTAHCGGRRHHRYTAHAADRDGDMWFGPLEPNGRSRRG